MIRTRTTSTALGPAALSMAALCAVAVLSGGARAEAQRIPPELVRSLPLTETDAPLAPRGALGIAAVPRAIEAPRPHLDARLRTSRRSTPDFDGRPDPEPPPEQMLAWLPRILFAPVWLVLDYVIRRPIGWLLTTAEREGWDVLLLDLFTWNHTRSSLVPTFFVAYGLQPSIGARVSSVDDVAPGHRISVSAAFGGVDYLRATGGYEIRLPPSERVRIAMDALGERRPDRVYSGVGWDVAPEQYRYRQEIYRVGASLELRPWRESLVRTRADVDGRAFGPDGYAALSADARAPSLREAIDQDRLQRPTGFDGYVAYRQSLRVEVDTREPEPAPGSGIRAEGSAEYVVDLDRTDRRWLRYGGGLGLFADLGGGRTLELAGIARFVDPLAGGPVPFSELIELGQRSPMMQGFLRGRLRGRSAVVATLTYRYPVWTHLDGQLHVAVGNAFAAHLTDFAMERLRLSFGFGLAVPTDPTESFELIVAAGTEPLVRGADVTSIQLLVGTQHGL